ncbi:MAG: caspase family protein [Gordonia sp. (in: high G+C Gram-positive bacteria)]
MARRALVVGINRYDLPGMTELRAAASDARAIADLLAKNADGTDNWEVIREIDAGKGIRANRLERALHRLLHPEFGSTKHPAPTADDELLIYFSGHAETGLLGGTRLATSEGSGIPFNDLLEGVHRSPAKAITILLDCCLSGAVGNDFPSFGNDPTRHDRAIIREGLTILTACRPGEEAVEHLLVDSRRRARPAGAFTRFLVAGLKGACADVLGEITAFDLYAYAAQGFVRSPAEQRPMLKSHVTHDSPIRRADATIDIGVLTTITDFFPDKEATVTLTPAHDHDPDDPTSLSRVDKDTPYQKFTGSAVQREFDHLKAYRDAGLVSSSDGSDFALCCRDRKTVELTALGDYYWDLVTTGTITAAGAHH